MKNHKICDSLAKYFRNESFWLTLSSSYSDSDSEKENKLTNSIKTAKRKYESEIIMAGKKKTKLISIGSNPDYGTLCRSVLTDYNKEKSKVQ